MRWLAEGKNRKWCAEQIGCSVGGIGAFERRHRQTIEEIRNNLADDFAGLYLASKQNRVAEYIQTIEDANQQIDKLLRAGKVVDFDNEGNEIGEHDVSEAVARLERGRHRALRSIAEELGQLPSRMALVIEDSRVRHELVGIDPKDL